VYLALLAPFFNSLSGGAQGLHQPCRIFSGISPPVSLANSSGSCLVKGANIRS